ncbi:MAG: SUMF1/EgtB/PvdO family nonheme iron enzyme, partial [Oligoflexus sp.]|nr:SUMF1/EgtB/PvdO family nonheme iron enzyme [Oligoflexus sp.]
LIATVSNCITATPANCTFADLSTKDGGSLVVGKVYNYILLVEDASGNAITPLVQRYRSPYFTGPALSAASAFRLEPRLRRASVFLVDEYHQQYQTRPQIMIHIPMEKSGLDHDFFVQKYESSLYSGSVSNNSPAGASDWPLQGSAAAWVKNAALCEDVFLQSGTFDLSGCGNGSAISASTGTVQSKQGTSPLASIDQGTSWKACRSSGFNDSDGKNYYLQLISSSERIKASDWGDTDQDGTIEASVNTYTGSVLITTLESGASDATTIRCHTDNNPSGPLLSNSSGAGSSSNCRSRYGVADMVGNVWEWSNSQYLGATGLDNGRDGLNLGRTQLLTGGYSLVSNLGSTFDLLRGIIQTAGAAALISANGDQFVSFGGLHGSNWGGAWSHGQNAGRWYTGTSWGTTGNPIDFGLRCTF